MRTAEEIAARERMNTSDNITALQLAEAEIRTGEKFAVSTGTGINPNP
jgi:Tfp pilus assembly protein PilX